MFHALLCWENRACDSLPLSHDMTPLRPHTVYNNTRIILSTESSTYVVVMVLSPGFIPNKINASRTMDLFNYQQNRKLRRWRIQMGCGIIDIYSNERRAYPDALPLATTMKLVNRKENKHAIFIFLPFFLSQSSKRRKEMREKGFSVGQRSCLAHGWNISLYVYRWLCRSTQRIRTKSSIAVSMPAFSAVGDLFFNLDCWSNECRKREDPFSVHT